MSRNETKKLELIQSELTPAITVYKDIIQNQSIELGFDPKKFWIDNALIKTYDYIEMIDHNLILKRGVQPSTR